MKHFEIVGWKLPTCSLGAQRLVELQDLLYERVDRLCLEAHFVDIDCLKALAAELPSSRFALYGWTSVDDASFFERPDCRFLQSARLTFGPQSVLLYPEAEMPDYDWDGSPSTLSHVHLLERHAEPVSANLQKPNASMTALIKQLAKETARPDVMIRTSTAMMGDYREHSYLVSIPSSKAASVAQGLCEALRLRNGFGSFEFLGAAVDVASLAACGRYSLYDFPMNTWSWNGSGARTPFALERASFLVPVLNMRVDHLLRIATAIDFLGSGVVRCSVLRKYLSWKLRPNRGSPKTQGNYMFLSRQKEGYAILLGFEQYADEDPPVKEFVAATLPLMERLRVKLKPVGHIK